MIRSTSATSGLRRRWATVLAWATACAMLSPAAWAEPTAEERATADALFREGRTLLNQKKYDEACPKLEESQRLDPQGGTLLSLAMCHEGQGRVASAWVEYEEAVSIARRANRPDRVRIASQRMKALQKRVPHLTIEVGSDVAVPELRVQRNGVEVAAPVWGTAVPVDPGSVEIVAEAPGRKPWRMTVELEEGKDKTVVLPQLAEEPKPPPPPPPPKPAQPSAPSTSPRTTLGLVIGGVGVVALGAGGYFGIRAVRKVGESNEHCSGSLCDQRGLDLNDEANRAAWLSNAFVGVGLVGVGVGTWMLLTSEPAHETAPADEQAYVTPVAGPGEAGILLIGSW